MHNTLSTSDRSRGFCAIKGLAGIVLSIVSCLLLVAPVQAAEVPLLYTAEVPFDSAGTEPNRTAYRLALTAVLVRLTGSVEAAQADELQQLFPNPDRFVSQFRRGSPDTLIVSFNGPEIERLLRQTGAPVWSSDRPLTMVWLAVDWGRGSRELIGADQQRPTSARSTSSAENKRLRERVEEVAIQRGAPVVFPLLDAQDLENVAFSDVWGGFDEPLVAASARYGASSILVGRIRPETARAHRWTWYRDGQRVDWRGEPEEIMHRLADTLAASDALPGNQQGEYTELTISGINSLRAYGQVQQYLEGLRVLDHLEIMTVTANKITYEVEVRGGVERLRSALESVAFLIPAEESGFRSIPFERRNGNSPVENEDRPMLGSRSLAYFYRERVPRSGAEVPLRN